MPHQIHNTHLMFHRRVPTSRSESRLGDKWINYPLVFSATFRARSSGISRLQVYRPIARGDGSNTMPEYPIQLLTTYCATCLFPQAVHGRLHSLIANIPPPVTNTKMSVMLPTKATLSVIYYGAAVVLLGVWLIRKILLTRRQLPLPPGCVLPTFIAVVPHMFV